MTVLQGEVWWADLGEPRGSKPGFRRPILVIQGDGLNRSRMATVVCVALTSNLKWASAPGNVLLSESYAVAAAREATLTLVKMLLTWRSMVFSLR